jgi:hypothetical protein
MKKIHKTRSLLFLIALLWTAVSFAQTKYEAESASLTGVSVATSHTGYTGTGYVDGFDNSADRVTFTVNVATAGAYPLVLRYSGPFGEKFQTLIVNGTTVSSCGVQFPANNNWADKAYGNVTLNAGNNTIAVVSCYGWFQLDYITVGTGGGTNNLTVSPATLNFTSSAGNNNVSVTSNVSWTVTDNQSWISASPASGSNNATVAVSVTANTGAARNGTVTITGGGITRTVAVSQGAATTTSKYEAESAALTGVTTATAGDASGGSFVTGMDVGTDKLVFTVNVATAGSYPLVIRFRNSCGACEKFQFVKVNAAAEVYTQFIATATGWTDKNYGNISLNAGNNTIEIRSSWGWTDFDYITVGAGGGTNNLSVSPGTLNVGAGPGNSNVSVTSNVSWTASDNQTWISLSPASGSNNGTIVVSVTANSGSSSRSGTVTVTGGSITQNVSVTQAGTTPAGPVTVGTNFWRIDWGNGWNDYFNSGVNWSSVTNPWRTDFINDMNPYSVLRFMDWGPTNGSEFVNWSSRVPKTGNNYNYQVPLTNGDGSTGTGAGVAYEWQIDLCNRAGSDMWINIPHKASDDFVRQLARLIRDNLSSTRKVYVEYSNEVWNWGFIQTHYAEDEGLARGFVGDFPFKGKNVYINSWWGYYVYRSCQVARIFEQEFAGQTTRLVKVLATQMGYGNWPDFVAIWGDIHPPTLQKMAALAQPAINPNNVTFDMFAIAPYWNGNDLAGMTASLNDIEDKMGEVQRALNDHGNGMKLICYEGGQDGGNQVANAQNPGIYNVYTDALNRIGARLQGPFVHYTHVGWDAGHAWGAKQSTGATLANSHKYRAIVDWVNAHGGPPAIRRPGQIAKEETAAANKLISIFPNPVKTNTITATVYSEKTESVTISVYNLASQKMSELKQVLQKGNNILQIPVGRLQNGVHTLVINKGGERVVRQVVIER